MAIQLPALMVKDPNIFGRFAQGQQAANQNRLLDMNAQNQEFQQNRATANDQFQREQYTDQQEQIMRQAEGMYFGRVGDMLAEYQGQPEIQRQIWKGARAKGEEIGIRDIHEMDDIDPTLPESIQMIRGQAAAYGYNPGANQTAEQRDFASMTKNLTPEEVEQARRVRLGLAPRASTSADERIADDPGLTERVAASKGAIKGAEAGASEQAKSDVQLAMKPKIQAAIKKAETSAKASGESLTDYQRASAALPGLQEVVGKLKTLSDVATYTMTGRAFDILAKELGFGATKGSTARSKMQSLVDNQILPLLRDTFGAQFTEREGESLRKTMLDINAAPEEKKAILDSFLEQKMRNLETKQGEISGLGGEAGATFNTPSQPQTQTGTGNKRLRYNPQTGQLE